MAPIKREVLQPEPEPGDLIFFCGEFVNLQCVFSITVYIFHDIVGREEAKKIRKVARLEVIEKYTIFIMFVFGNLMLPCFFIYKINQACPRWGEHAEP